MDSGWSVDRLQLDARGKNGDLSSVRKCERAGGVADVRRTWLSAWPSSWAPDGALLYTKREQTGTTRTTILDPAGAGERRQDVAVAPDSVRYVTDRHVSPDGKSVAYMSYESGQSEIYVVPFPATSLGENPGPAARCRFPRMAG